MQYYKYYLKNVHPGKRPRDKSFSYLITTNIHNKHEILGKKWLIQSIEIVILNKNRVQIAIFSLTKLIKLNHGQIINSR